MRLILFSLLLSPLFSACNRPVPPPPAPPPLEVTVLKVQAEDTSLKLEYVGQVAGFKEVEVRPRVAGILMKRNFEEGSHVAENHSLYSIDPVPYTIALKQAQADVQNLTAKAEQASHDVARLQPLAQAEAVSQKELDDASFNERALNAQLKSAELAVEKAQLDLTYTEVQAPLQGIIGRSYFSEGSLLSGPQDLLAQITQIDPVYVRFGMCDSDILQLNQGVASGKIQLPQGGAFEVHLILQDGSTYPSVGLVNFTDIRIQTASATSEAQALIENTSSLLRPGQFVRVKLEGAIVPNALLVPQRSIVESALGKSVFLLNDDHTVKSQPVTLGAWIGDRWVVEKGLKAGDVVVVDGVAKLKSGQQVKVGT